MTGGSAIAVRMWMCAAVLRMLKRYVSVETLVRLMHRRPSRRGQPPGFVEQIERYMTRRGRFPRRPPGNCFERSLGAYRLLCRAGAEPDLVVGVRRSAAGAVDGHVWVTVEGRPLADRDEDLAEFVPVVLFDANARRRGLESREGSVVDARLIR